MPAAPRKKAAAAPRRKPPRERPSARSNDEFASRVSPSQWDGASTFPPIASYAFLSDCHTGALIAPDGSVEWMCLPRFDQASIFGALLDRSA
ncbi:MAG: trehalase-like domain-containing protein, partial [Solirubrobacteraceae bacterium]